MNGAAGAAREPDAHDPRGARPGEIAASSGLVAAVTSFVPVLGEVVALPAAALAVGFGLLGVRRYETGRTRRLVPAVVGLTLGALAALGAAMVALAAR